MAERFLALSADLAICGRRLGVREKSQSSDST